MEAVSTARGLDANRVGKGLWIGSRPTTGSAVARAGFDVLVLCAEEIQPRSREFPGVFVVHAGIGDGVPSELELDTASWAARGIARAVSDGQRVLVTCHMGLNRSGLVTALALHALTGQSGRDCVRQVQRARRGALFNPHFRRLLERVPASR